VLALDGSPSICGACVQLPWQKGSLTYTRRQILYLLVGKSWTFALRKPFGECCAAQMLAVVLRIQPPVKTLRSFVSELACA
jgi:hypothetical protein